MRRVPASPIAARRSGSLSSAKITNNSAGPVTSTGTTAYNGDGGGFFRGGGSVSTTGATITGNQPDNCDPVAC